MNFYLHIPFCRQKCPYCKFALTPVYDDIKKRRYLSYLEHEIRNYFSLFPEKNIQSIYFGGGTPSSLTLNEVGSILRCFPLQRKCEISFECNPEDITEEYIRGILDLSISRISLGIQSLNNKTLQKISRAERKIIKNALDIIERIYKEHEESFSLNIDLILGLPDTKAGETLEAIEKLHVKYSSISHTSVYMLESGDYPHEWKTLTYSEKEMEKEYGDICDYFQKQGWHHYEMSNWARPGKECQHNQGYWTHQSYRGFGLSATSYIDGVRTNKSGSFTGYYRGEEEREVLSEKDIELEKYIYGLRTFSLLADIPSLNVNMLEKFENEGLLMRKEGKIILTPAGIFRENFILSELLD